VLKPLLILLFPLILFSSLVGCSVQKEANPVGPSPVPGESIPILVLEPEGAVRVGAWDIQECTLTLDPTPVMSLTDHPAEIRWDGKRTVVANADLNADLTGIKKGWSVYQRSSLSYSPHDNPEREFSIREKSLIITDHLTKTERAYPLPEQSLEQPAGTMVLWAAGSPQEARVLIHYFRPVPGPNPNGSHGLGSGLLLATITESDISWSEPALNGGIVQWQLPQVVALKDKLYIGGIENVLQVDLQQNTVSLERSITALLQALVPSQEEIRQKDILIAGPSLGCWNDVLLAGLRVGNEYYVKAIQNGKEIGAITLRKDRTVLTNASGRAKEQPSPNSNSVLVLPQGRTSW